jgi:iron-sulfur cluster repair protein YtfE (RIC family)
MRRSPELTKLSHHHHVALEHALRLRRVEDDEVHSVVGRYLEFFAEEGDRHMAIEEEVLAPALAGERDVRTRLLVEHLDIRRRARALGRWATRRAAVELGERLTAHVRFEERELFPLLEARLTAAELAAVGRRLTS